MPVCDCCYRRTVTTSTHHSRAPKAHAMSTVTKVVNLILNLCLLLVGIMHVAIIIDRHNEFCEDVFCDKDSVKDCSCMGSFIIWNEDDFTDEHVKSLSYSSGGNTYK